MALDVHCTLYEIFDFIIYIYYKNGAPAVFDLIG